MSKVWRHNSWHVTGKNAKTIGSHLYGASSLVQNWRVASKPDALCQEREHVAVSRSPTKPMGSIDLGNNWTYTPSFSFVSFDTRVLHHRNEFFLGEMDFSTTTPKQESRIVSTMRTNLSHLSPKRRIVPTNEKPCTTTEAYIHPQNIVVTSIHRQHHHILLRSALSA